MKREIEVEAGTVQEAIVAALKELRVKRNKVEIKVLREEQKGLFGLQGAKGAKVRVTAKKRE